MEASESRQSASRETCLGLPLLEERQITEEEGVMLQEEARRSLWRSFAWGCSAPFVFLVLIFIGGSLIPDNNNASLLQVAPGSIIMVLSFGLGAAFFLLANDRFKRRKTAKEDLRNGVIKCYQGFVPGVDKDNLPEPEARSGAEARIAGVDISVFEPVVVEVFRDSRRLWQVNGKRVKKLICVPEEHTAFQPEQAQTAAKWVEPARVVAENTIDISQSGRRELSTQETDEITHRARTTWRKPGLLALLFTAYLGAQAIRQWQGGLGVNLQWSTYIYIALLIWIDVKSAKIAWRSWRLSKDVNLGIAIITRYPDDMNGEEVLRKGAVVEWLPHSNSQWTINGEPARWRLRR